MISLMTLDNAPIKLLKPLYFLHTKVKELGVLWYIKLPFHLFTEKQKMINNTIALSMFID